jgi:hypothetical protein
MANSLLTPTVILREAGRVFHEKAKFLRSIDRQYDNRFKLGGVKAGQTIALRDANEFTVTSGAVMNVQDASESSQNLTIGTQKHVAFQFNAVDLSMTIQDYSERYIDPAMARLVANVESDVVTQAYKATANLIDGDAAAFAFTHVAQAKQRLDEADAPDDDQRALMLCPTHATKYLVDTKGLFTPQGKLGAQYGDGMVKDALGFNIFATNKLTAHQTGTAAKASLYVVSGANQTGASVTVATGTTTFLKGDVVTFAGCNAVDPETKASLGYLKQFTITADSGANATSLAISPSIVVTGGKQNVSASPTDTGNVVKIGAGANETLVQSLAFHKEAFVFATADLEDPSRYGQWGTTQQMDTLSMRIWRTADIVNDQFPCRIDVFYGFLARYPKIACRIHADG